MVLDDAARVYHSSRGEVDVRSVAECRSHDVRAGGSVAGDQLAVPNDDRSAVRRLGSSDSAPSVAWAQRLLLAYDAVAGDVHGVDGPQRRICNQYTALTIDCDRVPADTGLRRGLRQDVDDAPRPRSRWLDKQTQGDPTAAVSAAHIDKPRSGDVAARITRDRRAADQSILLQHSPAR